MRKGSALNQKELSRNEKIRVEALNLSVKMLSNYYKSEDLYEEVTVKDILATARIFEQKIKKGL